MASVYVVEPNDLNGVLKMSYEIFVPDDARTSGIAITIFDESGKEIGWRFLDRPWFLREVLDIPDPTTQAVYLIARDECIDRGLIAG